MKQLAIVTSLAVALSGCGTSLTYNNGDINWKAVAVSTAVIVIGGAVLNEAVGEINHSGHVTSHSQHEAGLCVHEEYGRGFCD